MTCNRPPPLNDEETEDLSIEEQLAEIYRVVMEDDMSAPLTVEEFKIVMESWTQTIH